MQPRATGAAIAGLPAGRSPVTPLGMALPAPAHPNAPPTPAQRIARSLMRIIGWRRVLAPMPAPKGIVVVYPHTSNWDFIIGVLYKLEWRLPVRWMGKHTLFRWPLRRLLLRLGGIPIQRGQNSGAVDAMLAEFARSDWMWLVVTPEGTRSRTEYWKSGFYRMAVAGSLPVGLGFIDYATRTIGIDTYLTMTGDESRDFERMREFYAGKRGHHPENQGEIRLRP
jgi:hypothetical protein